MIEEARALAQKAHAGQIRKSNGLGYYETHLVECESIAVSYGGSHFERAAALLHDLIEDTRGNLKAVAEIDSALLPVLYELSEDKEEGWEWRKQSVINHIPRMTREAAFVKACDIMSNIRGLYRDGFNDPNIWSKFKRAREQSLWFYHECISALSKRRDLPEAMIKEMWWFYGEVSAF